MSSPEPRDRVPLGPLVLAAVAAVVLLYSVLIAQQLLLGALVVGVAFVVYLLWRFVRATERIATALENRDG